MVTILWYFWILWSVCMPSYASIFSYSSFRKTYCFIDITLQIMCEICIICIYMHFYIFCFDRVNMQNMQNNQNNFQNVPKCAHCPFTVSFACNNTDDPQKRIVAPINSMSNISNMTEIMTKNMEICFWIQIFAKKLSEIKVGREKSKIPSRCWFFPDNIKNMQNTTNSMWCTLSHC